MCGHEDKRILLLFQARVFTYLAGKFCSMNQTDFPSPDDIAHLPSKAKQKKAENKKYFEKLKRKKPQLINQTIAQLHDEVFARTNCLNCANCCKTTGPLFTQKDIERIAKHLNQKPAEFSAQYLRIDEDNDYVLQQVPCPFLATDNYCAIYDVRPKACREYPHTDAGNFNKLFNITLKNTAVCPAVYDIVELLKQKLPA